jgi:hypothetical protein
MISGISEDGVAFDGQLSFGHGMVYSRGIVGSYLVYSEMTDEWSLVFSHSLLSTMTLVDLAVSST